MRRPTLALVPLLLALALTGCTGGGDDADTTASAGAGSGAESLDTGAAPAPAEAGAPPDAAASAPLGRVTLAGAELIRTAQLGVQVDDVRAAADRAVDITVAAAGLVTSEQSSGAEGYGDASLVLRIPPERFDGVVGDLAGLGTELRRSVGVEDVGDQVVDLESRLATQRASVERVRALLEQAQSLADVVQVEGELTRRTADLESLQARLAAITERVDLATVTLDLYAADSPAATQQGETIGFLEGLRGGWAALLATLRVLGATAGALLPFVPLLLLAALAWRLRARRATAAPSA